MQWLFTFFGEHCTYIISDSFTTSEVTLSWNRYGAFKYIDEFSTSGLELSSVEDMRCSTNSGFMSYLCHRKPMRKIV
jgi:hypothetical protein